MALYDKVAEDYDNFYDDEFSHSENDAVAKVLLPHTRGGGVRILDMGCGTGVLFDIMPTLRHEMKAYTGVDISPEMIKQFAKKHPVVADYYKLQAEGVENISIACYDMYLSLFGSPSYFSDEFLARLAERLRYGGKYLLMFYKDGYKSRVLGEYDYQYADPSKHFDNVIEFSNYRIVSNIWKPNTTLKD